MVLKFDLHHLIYKIDYKKQISCCKCNRRNYLSFSEFRPCESANVAFTLGQTNNLYLIHGEQMSYNKAITNLSAHFDSLGSFVCKKPGLYAFHHFFSLAHTQSRTWMELYKNADYVCSIYGFTTHCFADAGNSVLLHLNENDVISIRSHASTNTTLYGTLDQIYTTFTGVFLNPDINGKTPFTYSLYYDFYPL